MSEKISNRCVNSSHNLSEEQFQKIAPIEEDLFAERESLQEIQKAVNDEILALMKNKTTAAAQIGSGFNIKLRKATSQAT